MKLKLALDIGRDCGLSTVGEAMLNIDIHAISIFDYGKMAAELHELHDEWNSLKDNRNYNDESSIEQVLDSLDQLIHMHILISLYNRI